MDVENETVKFLDFMILDNVISIFKLYGSQYKILPLSSKKLMEE